LELHVSEMYYHFTTMDASKPYVPTGSELLLYEFLR
jgi:hypothetical protein